MGARNTGRFDLGLLGVLWHHLLAASAPILRRQLWWKVSAGLSSHFVASNLIPLLFVL